MNGCSNIERFALHRLVRVPLTVFEVSDGCDFCGTRQ